MKLRTEATLHRCSYKKAFWEICSKFTWENSVVSIKLQTKPFLRTPLKGCYCTYVHKMNRFENQVKRIAELSHMNQWLHHFTIFDFRWSRTLQKNRSSRSQMFLKISIFKSFANFTGKHLSWSLFLTKRDTNAGVSPWKLRNF